MPLTELVHYFNKRQASGPTGRVAGRLRDRRWAGAAGFCGPCAGDPVPAGRGAVAGRGDRPRGASAGRRRDAAGRVPAQAVSEARDDDELVHLDRSVRTLHALNFLLEREQHGVSVPQRASPADPFGVRSPRACVRGVLARCGLTPDRIVLELADDGFGDPRGWRWRSPNTGSGATVAIDNFGRHSADLERLERAGAGRRQAGPLPDRPLRAPQPGQAGDDRAGGGGAPPRACSWHPVHREPAAAAGGPGGGAWIWSWHHAIMGPSA